MSAVALLLASTVAVSLQGSGQSPAGPGDTVEIYSGRAHATVVRAKNIQEDITIDGRLDEGAWKRASLLTGFSQYDPNDGLPASDSTQVLVWYSSNAIHFGIRAFESHGAATATLADRDRIFGDDNIQILLGTFPGAHEALMFAVNPLGVQADGTLSEGANTGAIGFIGSASSGREQANLSPDYVFQSRGHVTDWGYEVEVRIPFKSLRYQPAKEQTWKINFVREVKHSGFEDTWVPAVRAAPSFLAQSGELTGLHDLHRGIVLDVNPDATLRSTGAPDAAGDFRRINETPQLGGTARWGITNSMTLLGTVHPDFSQVESDAGQLGFDPRQALFFAEKRPFFLEGSELFQVPNNLIYTRRIQQPVAAAKLTGNAAGMTIGLLSAVDQQFASATGHDNPVFNIVRLQSSIGGNPVAVAYTDRVDGATSNRVADVDGRISFANIYSVNYQLAGSRTSEDGDVSTAPLWQLFANRNGHHLGIRALFAGIGDEFRTESGFIGRAGVVHSYIGPGWTVYGSRGATLERFNGEVVLDGIWQYQNFIHGRGLQDKKLHFNATASLRGGWTLNGGWFVESFGYDSLLYSNYRLERTLANGAKDTVPFVGQPTIPNSEWLFQLQTPQWRTFNLGGFYLQGHDENFFEWSSGALKLMSIGGTWRPTDRVRAELTYNWQQINRRTDGTLVNVGRIPRAKVEYQIARGLFVRAVGQYVQTKTDSLRDDSRTGAPILLVTSNGVVRSAASQDNQFHSDFLVSYQPVPGTVVLAGYGSDMQDESAFGFSRLARTRDALFMKVSWLFRL
jgi:hypothetical protein